MKGGRDEYERLATAIYSGAKWKIEKRKEKLECYPCGGEHYRRECPLNTAKGSVMDKNEMERKMDGKEMERKMDGKEERMDRRKNERGTWESNDRKRRSDGFEWGGKRERSTNEGVRFDPRGGGLKLDVKSLGIVSAYAPQNGLKQQEKERFYEQMDKIVRSMSKSEMLVVAGDFNGHVGRKMDSLEYMVGEDMV
ncbi:hypothetical protein PRIPAC_79456 [Pristionchus pacificus]|uniref:Uncharacterized protein n=1 Tax=Pristionchus pacificus TaxID=54126 RepID=A0A2A6CL00_PRIPA|nr:hypothetical protein PRIPAC_79456 [Pristionchus pacificus]|eukprot:PDM78780.1 hypothetical protein PRIPAC_31359 [Pristionchus pacificus]